MYRFHFADCSVFHSSQDMGPTYGSSAPGGLGRDSVDMYTVEHYTALTK